MHEICSLQLEERGDGGGGGGAHSAPPQGLDSDTVPNKGIPAILGTGPCAT